MTTEKPPVPSDDELGRIDNYAANYIMGRRALWLAGYHARDGEVASLQPEAMSKFYAELKARIAELEAEVAELRKALFEKTDDQSWDRLWDILGKYCSSAESLSTAARRLVRMVDAAPRRTPELTERVASWVLQRFYDGNNLMRDAARLTAGALLDLVFGKERTYG